MALRDEVLARRAEVRAIVEAHGGLNPRLFGSVARGEELPDSDIDVLVDNGGRLSYLKLGGMALDLAALFRRRVDVRTPQELHPSMLGDVTREAVAL